MEEEITQKTIALAMKAARMDADVLKAAMRMYLNYRRQRKQNAQHKPKEEQHGKISVKELMGKDAGASSIDISNGCVKSFEKIARKYNVDFAIKKDRTTNPPKYLVFFKGRDTDAIAQAFKEFVYGNEKKKNRPSLRQKLQKHKEEAEKKESKEKDRDKKRHREKKKEKHKDRGQER